jgi:hypothetical protein
MDSIPPDIAKKLLARDLGNLISRVQKGGKLARAERVMLQSMASGTGTAKDTAANLVELAAILGVARQSIHKWKKRKDAPKAAPNGTHDVGAWRDWMNLHGIKSDEASAQDTAELSNSLKARKLLAEVEDREWRLKVRQGDYFEVEEVRQFWTESIARATAMLRKKFEQELPPLLTGLDAAAIQEENRRAIDEVLTMLHTE